MPLLITFSLLISIKSSSFSNSWRPSVFLNQGFGWTSPSPMMDYGACLDLNALDGDAGDSGETKYQKKFKINIDTKRFS